MIKLIWDFHGPDAIQIAEHHAKHLGDFIVKERLEQGESGVDREDDTYAMAWMKVKDGDMEKVRDALRPHRGFKTE